MQAGGKHEQSGREEGHGSNKEYEEDDGCEEGCRAGEEHGEKGCTEKGCAEEGRCEGDAGSADRRGV